MAEKNRKIVSLLLNEVETLVTYHMEKVEVQGGVCPWQKSKDQVRRFEQTKIPLSAERPG